MPTPIPEANLFSPATTIDGKLRSRSLTLPVMRDPSAGAAAKRQALLDIIDTLKVESAKRYKPVGPPGPTWCNIYAHDFARLAAVYIPRVWWTPKALKQLAAGKTVAAVYAKTVGERSANELVSWMAQFGPAFGWEILYDGKPNAPANAAKRNAAIATVQDAANAGQVATIIALAPAHGHIVMVAPEDTSAGAPAELRRGTHEHGDLYPVQSQAGRNLVARSSKRETWWRDGVHTRVLIARHA